MPTKRFVWKDRDTAALDLIQLAYYAPPFISQDALDILSAIRSEAIVPDLKEITLDSERKHWDRIYALRAIASVSGDVYFPELAAIVETDLSSLQQVAAQSGRDIDYSLKQIDRYMIEDVILFAASHPVNERWLWQCLDPADPLVVCAILTHHLAHSIPEEMSTTILHRLIVLLETHPDLLNMSSIGKIYDLSSEDTLAQAFLNTHFDAIVEKAVSTLLDDIRDSWFALSPPFRWSALKAAIFQRRPDFEEKYLRGEAQNALDRSKRQELWREDFSYKETAIWRELEALYEQVRQGDSQKIHKLWKKCYDATLSIPVRAAATHFLGKLRDYPRVFGMLIGLAHHPGDSWDMVYSPIQFEAAKALFEIGTPKAWEALVAAAFTSTSNTFQNFLNEWIACLTDQLSGVSGTPPITDGIENRWFKALIKESTGESQ